MAMLGLTIVPSLLVLGVGGELIRSVTQFWFSQPIDEVLRSANEIGANYYREHQKLVGEHARRIAGAIPARAVETGNVNAVRAAIGPEVTEGKLGLVEIYRLTPEGAPLPLVAVESALLPRENVSGMADRLAATVASGSGDTRAVDQLDTGGELVRAGAIIREPLTNRPVGVVIASEYLSGDLAEVCPAHHREHTRTTVSSTCCGRRSRASTCRSS